MTDVLEIVENEICGWPDGWSNPDLEGHKTALCTRYCSGPWIRDALDLIESGADRGALAAVYPPGGRQRTLMRKCCRCKRWSPPNKAVSPPPDFDADQRREEAALCCDCEMEQAEEAFDGRCSKLPDLRRMWWTYPRAPGLAEQPNGEIHAVRWFSALDVRTADKARAIRNPYNAPALGPPLISIPSVPTWTRNPSKERASRWGFVPLEVRRAIDEESRRPRKSSASRDVFDRRRITNRLAGQKDEPGRAYDCKVILLPDDDEALRAEIDYYCWHHIEHPDKRGRHVVPTAKTVNSLYARTPAGNLLEMQKIKDLVEKGNIQHPSKQIKYKIRKLDRFLRAIAADAFISKDPPQRP